jgi:hypothetical protein
MSTRLERGALAQLVSNQRLFNLRLRSLWLEHVKLSLPERCEPIRRSVPQCGKIVRRA